MKKTDWSGALAVGASFIAAIGAFGGLGLSLYDREYVIAFCIVVLAAMAVPFLAGLWRNTKLNRKDDAGE